MGEKQSAKVADEAHENSNIKTGKSEKSLFSAFDPSIAAHSKVSLPLKRKTKSDTGTKMSARSNMTMMMDTDTLMSGTSPAYSQTSSQHKSTVRGRITPRHKVISMQKLDKPSFGTTSERFGIVSLHPRAWTQVTNKAISLKFASTNTGFHLSPASYHIKRLWEAEERTEDDKSHGWTRQVYLEKFSQLPSVINRHLFEVEKELRRRLGPGTYNIQTEIKKPESTRPLLCSHSSRLPRDPSLRFCTPGPGTYGKGGIPVPQLGEYKSFGTYSSLEKRVCKRSVLLTDSGLAPGTYNVKDGKELIKRSSGKRGPYDIFSGKRDKPITTGHRPTVPTTNPDLEYNPRGFECLERLNSRENRKKGEFLKAPQYPAHSGERICGAKLPVPLVDAIKPSPADYNAPAPKAGKISEQKMQSLQRLYAMNPLFGFDCATKREFTYQHLSQRTPGPGYYSIKRFATLPKNPKPSSMFSGAVRDLGQKTHNLFRQRLRAQNVARRDFAGFQSFVRNLFYQAGVGFHS